MYPPAAVPFSSQSPGIRSRSDENPTLGARSDMPAHRQHIVNDQWASIAHNITFKWCLNRHLITVSLLIRPLITNDKCSLFVFNEAVMTFFDRIWAGGGSEGLL